MILLFIWEHVYYLHILTYVHVNLENVVKVIFYHHSSIVYFTFMCGGELHKSYDMSNLNFTFEYT